MASKNTSILEYQEAILINKENLFNMLQRQMIYTEM